jgi:hypothetical protein
VDVPFTAARKDKPVLSCYPVDCDYIKDNLRSRSRADAIKLMPESFGLEPGSCSWLSQARALPKWSQRRRSR